LKPINLCQLFHGALQSNAQIEACIFLPGEDSSMVTSDWPEHCPAGNLLNFCYFTVATSALHKTVDGISKYLPFSYLPCHENVLKCFEAQSTASFSTAAFEKKRGRRNFFHDSVFHFLFNHVKGWDKEEIQQHLKELFGFGLTSRQLLEVNGYSEAFLSMEQLRALKDSVISFTRQHSAFFEEHPAIFTKHPLNEYGINFPGGCFYECSGYGLHCFYLPDMEGCFFFYSTAGFIEVWYTFIVLLSDFGYFQREPSAYLECLERELLIYPWYSLEIQSQ
jgi:hypothetical protein